MDAYVLGTHDGELPTHLLGQGDNRIRAMARLEGPDHNIFYALEVPDGDGVDSHVKAISDAGTIIGEILLHHQEAVGFILVFTHPSHLPPWDRYLFVWVEIDGLEAALTAASERLGSDGVAVAADADGRALVELGSNDADALGQAAASFGGAAHAVGAGGIIRG